MIELVARAARHRDRPAIVDEHGTYTYERLLDASARVSSGLLDDQVDLAEQRVAVLSSSTFQYVAAQWGIWRAGGIAVPLAVSHPQAELAHVIDDSGATIVVASPGLEDRVQPLAVRANARFVRSPDLLSCDRRPLPDVDDSRRALMIYTSGTTGKPKGAVSTHAAICAQVRSLVEAWEWVAEDRILLVLPLHHVHGVINVLTCALWSGACCHMLPRFDPCETWQHLTHQPITLFMAVPTIYQRLISSWEDAPAAEQAQMSAACGKLRLMVSGSAALPATVLARWRELSGHVLLERYGMTETGMVLSNPLHGTRVPGAVGTALPGVEVRLVDEDRCDVPPEAPGEILVRGPAVFREYWGKPALTAEAFHDGWFMTGDVAVEENGRYRLIGRQSVDIIKTGGHKVSALEIEEVLRTHPAVTECAVVGVPDPDWGERVCVAAELKAGVELALDELRHWAGKRLAPYKVPKSLECVTSLPRNAMGKVTKPAIVTLFQRSRSGGRG